MKKSICSKCNKEYWAQTTKAILTPLGDGGHRLDWPSEVKTNLCKKHASPTQMHHKTAKWRQSGVKRHTRRPHRRISNSRSVSMNERKRSNE